MTIITALFSFYLDSLKVLKISFFFKPNALKNCLKSTGGLELELGLELTHSHMKLATLFPGGYVMHDKRKRVESI